MKKILTLFLFLLFHETLAQQVLSDQEFTMILGAPYKIPGGYIHLGGFGDSDTNLVQLIYKPGKDLIIQSFDSALSMAKETRIDISALVGDFESERIARLGNRYFWFFKSVDRITLIQSLWVQEVDIYNGKLVGKLMPVVLPIKVYGTFEMRFCNDKSKMLIVYRLKHKSNLDKINHEEIGFCVIDSSLNKLIDKVYLMPYTEAIMNIKDFLVDNRGIVFFLTRINDPDDHLTWNSLPNFHFELFRARSGVDTLEIMKVNLPKKFYPRLVLREISQGGFMVAGYYSYSFVPEKSDGVIMARMNDEGLIKTGKNDLFEFPDSTLRQFKSELAHKEAHDLVIRHAGKTENGGMLLLGEVSYSLSSGYNEETSGEILTMYLDEFDNPRCIVIPKQQVGDKGKLGNSFKYFKNKNDLYLFYADHPKNIGRPIKEKPYTYQTPKDGCLAYAKIDAKGNVSKVMLYNFSKDKFIYHPSELRFVGNNSLAGIASHGQMNRLVLIKIRP